MLKAQYQFGIFRWEGSQMSIAQLQQRTETMGAAMQKPISPSAGEPSGMSPMARSFAETSKATGKEKSAGQADHASFGHRMMCWLGLKPTGYSSTNYAARSSLITHDTQGERQMSEPESQQPAEYVDENLHNYMMAICEMGYTPEQVRKALGHAEQTLTVAGKSSKLLVDYQGTERPEIQPE